MTDHTIKSIAMLEEYFGEPGVTPIIVEEFTSAVGWTRPAWRKRIGESYACTLRDQGISHVRLSHGERTADFSLDEILRSARQAR